ncbi:ATP-binding cassette domain-containing protein, partial [Rhizobium leguminosarum]|uniref:ATP-binding cassette domain-containing protein n=1 Tax=Rhizobium leguminosarum TaxID=384 RepID=UPI003F982182
HSGKTLAVVGESGCGKSTLARLVTMIENPTSGQLLIDGKPAHVGYRSLRSQVQIVFQNPYGSFSTCAWIDRSSAETGSSST